MSYYDILLAKQLSGGGGGVTVESLSVTANGTYTAPSGKAYTPVSVAVPQPTGTKSITTNGTHDVTAFASASVAVPNSYTASDEGKVVSSGALVAQTSQTIDTNGTYDTTLKNSVTVNVSGGGGSGLEYETGAWTPTADTLEQWILFTNQHEVPPAFVAVSDTEETVLSGDASYKKLAFVYYNIQRALGTYIKKTSSTNIYGLVTTYNWQASSTSQSTKQLSTPDTNTSIAMNDCSQYWAQKDRFHFGSTDSNSQWKTGHTYKWIAIWAPTS